MEELLFLIRTRRNFLFTDLFEGRPVTVRVLVATFIAVLELTRLRKLRVRQDEAYADIHVEAVDDTLNPDGTPDEGQLNFSPDAPAPSTSVRTEPTYAPAPSFSEAEFATIPSVLSEPNSDSVAISAPDAPAALENQNPLEPLSGRDTVTS
jgi:hypothetical protein